tara:strand:+ start:521 stop:715 length:195 start_codon:yes stop_codon:yes gene_type:complete
MLIPVMRKISKATKRAIEAGGAFTPTRRAYKKKARSSIGKASGGHPRLGEDWSFFHGWGWKDQD